LGSVQGEPAGIALIDDATGYPKRRRRRCRAFVSSAAVASTRDEIVSVCERYRARTRIIDQ
jgi:hypothetical protein